MISVLILISGVALWLVVFHYLERRFTCKCGRSCPPYFYVKHERAGVMLFYAVWFTLITAMVVLTHSTVWTVLNVLCTVFYWRAWWKHESGKYKKRAAKMAARVSMNRHGRLVVE